METYMIYYETLIAASVRAGAHPFSRRQQNAFVGVAAEERKLLERHILAEDGVLHLLHGLGGGLPRIGNSSRYQEPTRPWSLSNPLAPSPHSSKIASFPFSSSLASHHFGAPTEKQTSRLPGTAVFPSDQYYQDLAGHCIDDGYTALPRSLFIGTGESTRRLLASQSILQRAINGRTTMLSSSTASSMNATTALGRPLLLGGQNLVEKLNNDMKHHQQEGKFPVILHQALLELERVGDTSTAAFLPDGKSFAIINQSIFEKRILPIFFPKMKGFASFQRQLNLYDFKRIGGAGVDRGSYCHELFHRDCPSKAREMNRTKHKGGKPRHRRSSATRCV
jgi:hypothetical protein